MKNKWIIFVSATLIAGFSQADIIYHDYSSAPITADTKLNDSDSTTKKLYISAQGVASTTAPSENSVYFTAYRAQQSSLDYRYTESVLASSGLNIASLNPGDSVNKLTNFEGGYIFNREVNVNVGSDEETVGPQYLGFRVSDGEDNYFYGWVEMSAKIQTDYGFFGSDNRAMVQITQVAISDTAGEFIEVGQMIPEPAVMELIVAAGGSLLLIRRRFFS